MPTTTAVEPPGGVRAWLVWAVAVGVYFLAMFHRNGLGVAALEAQERFQVGPALLSALPVMQLVVYLVLQMPAGLLADRLGPRRTLLMGLLAMVAGVVLFAVAPNIHVAIAARVLIGAGDAVTFLNVLRLGALWFPRSQYALVSAFTGMIGGLGQVASVVPLSAALRGLGWTAAFLGAGAVTAVMVLLVLLVVRDRPAGMRDGHARKPLPVWASLVEAAKARGSRVGMANHIVMQAPYTMLAALWGYPFLVAGMGFAPAAAGLVLTVLGVATLWTSPVIGALIGRRPGVRKPTVLVSAVLLSLGWIALVAWPGGPPPAPVVVAHLACCSAAMMMAAPLSFDFARDGVPAHRTGVAAGLVNMSGFLAVVLTTVGAGLILEALPEPPSGPAFQLAFLPVAATTVAAALVLIVQLWRYPRVRR
ncbi:MFS transporter [Allosalinactinospora lopnorensis]|uniref:MFS transporter n=1 Tax=Allosalinactinospora lopnorensis TaxID=1352348 RepID=UPI000623DB5E|nr:MFS transporter [Allosalinactinospora lopnorensis]